MSERKLTGVVEAGPGMSLDALVRTAEEREELCCHTCGVTISRWGSFRFDEEVVSEKHGTLDALRSTFYCSRDCVADDESLLTPP